MNIEKALKVGAVNTAAMSVLWALLGIQAIMAKAYLFAVIALPLSCFLFVEGLAIYKIKGDKK